MTHSLFVDFFVFGKQAITAWNREMPKIYLYVNTASYPVTVSHILLWVLVKTVLMVPSSFFREKFLIKNFDKISFINVEISLTRD